MEVRYPASLPVELNNGVNAVMRIWSAPEMVTRVKHAWPNHLVTPSLFRCLSLFISFVD